MGNFVFCLEPEKELFDKIWKSKEEIKQKIGDSLYLSDPPHLTLYIGKFGDDLLGKINDWFRNNKDVGKIFMKEVHTFERDSVTKGNTIVYMIDKTEELLRFQTGIIEFLSKFRIEEFVKRYEGLNLTGEFKENLEKYSYPFVGKIWLPHFGIGTFSEENYNKLDIGKLDNLEGSEYKFSYLVIYELNEETEKIREVDRIKI